MKVCAVLCLFLAATSVAQVAPPDLRSALDTQLRNNAELHSIPAQAVMVLHNGSVLYRNATGTTTMGSGVPVTAKSIFPIYSMSKLFASTLAMQLAEEGKLALSAPASRYVTTLPASWSAIRVDQFLSHVSGVPEYFDSSDFSRPFPASLDAVFSGLKTVPLLAAPGERTRYTQTNYLVIEAVLEAVTKTPYRELVRQRILTPLELQETWLDTADIPKARLVASYRAEKNRVVPEPAIAWPDYSVAHAGIHMTVDDVGKFLSAVAQGKLVSKAALQQLWQPYRFANGNTGFFASGWDYAESGSWHELGHDGGTKVRGRILFEGNLDEHYVIVYLTNGNKDDVWSRTLVDSVQTLILADHRERGELGAK